MFETEAEEFEKSKRTPPLYEELMKELGFIKNANKEIAALKEDKETPPQIQVGRMNGKSQKCLEALIKLEVVKTASTETLLKELKDRGVIRSWYYNGSYHVGSELQ